jgi:hypothetical protein
MSDSSSTIPAPAVTQKTESTPFSRYFARLDAFIDSQPNGLGSMLVRGVPRKKKGGDGDDEDEDEEEDDDEDDEAEKRDDASYTEDEVNYMRRIIITKRRADLLEKASAEILGDQAGSPFLSFNTSFSYVVCDVLASAMRRVTKAKTADMKFDLLLAFTRALMDYDVWIHDHECGWEGPKLIKRFAKLWKDVLTLPDAEIGIDSEYTRPGVIEFLTNFKQKVEEVDYGEDDRMRFRFQ